MINIRTELENLKNDWYLVLVTEVNYQTREVISSFRKEMYFEYTDKEPIVSISLLNVKGNFKEVKRKNYKIKAQEYHDAVLKTYNDKSSKLEETVKKTILF